MSSASGYNNLLASNGLVNNVKHFDALFTPIAVSENGYLAVYYPYIPERIQKTSAFSKITVPEQPERLEVLHISQINDFDIEYTEDTKVKSGAGGALAGALLGGVAGAIIGGALTSGVKGTITDISLVINTNDFNKPRMEVSIYRGYQLKLHPHTYCPLALQKHLDKVGLLSKEGKNIAREVYGIKSPIFSDLEPNIAQIEALESTLTQMLSAYQQSEITAVSAPQISNADELAKFKSLLDSGVITQQEFDTKKKQLLGL